MSGKLIPTTRRVHLSMQCIIRAGRARMYYYFPLSYGFIHSSVHCMFIIMINAHLESWILCLILMITPEILPLELLPFSSSREIERNHHSPVTMRMNSY